MATQQVSGSVDKVIAGGLPGVMAGAGPQVYDANIVLSRIPRGEWEGESTQIAVNTAEYNKAQSYQNDDTVKSTNAVEVLTAGQFELGGYNTSINIAGMKIRKVMSNPKKVVNILKFETDLSLMDMKDKMADHLFQSTNDSKGLLSLSTITDASTTIAGISGSSTWGGTTTASGSFASQGKTDLMTLHSTLSRYGSLDKQKGGDEPNLNVTRSTERDYYWVSLESSMRYKPAGSGDVKLNLTFWGHEIVADEHCASGVWYMLNTSKLKLLVMKSANFKVFPPTRSEAQPDMYNSAVIWNGQITFNTRRYSGKLTGITA